MKENNEGRYKYINALKSLGAGKLQHEGMRNNAVPILQAPYAEKQSQKILMAWYQYDFFWVVVFWDHEPTVKHLPMLTAIPYIFVLYV